MVCMIHILNVKEDLLLNNFIVSEYFIRFCSYTQWGHQCVESQYIKNKLTGENNGWLW